MARLVSPQAAPNKFTAEAAAALKPRPRLAGLWAAAGRRLHDSLLRPIIFAPWMRRVIPLLLIIFLALTALIRGIALYEWRQSLEAADKAGLRLAAAALAAQIDNASSQNLLPPAGPAAKSGKGRQARSPADAGSLYLHNMLAQFLSDDALNPAMQLAVLDKAGRIAASSAPLPSAGGKGRLAAEAEFPAALRLGADLSAGAPELKPLLIMGSRAGAFAVPINGRPGFAAYASSARAGYGVFAYLDEQAILAPWQRAVSINITLLGSLACLMLALVYAYLAQGTRAAKAARATDHLQSRINTAMLRGRCGLWDWDMAGGRIYWSHSMYEMLGYRPYDTPLSIAEVAAIIDPDDLDLFELAKSAMSGEKEQFDITVPMRHANGRAVWMRIRAQVVSGEEPHLVGISFDVSEQQELAEKNATADMRIRDAIENISEAFVLWDADNQLVMSNSKYREYKELEKPLLQMKNSNAYQDAAFNALIKPKDGIGYKKDKNGNYSGEIELTDSSWLKLNGRKTRDGGFVLVGTDISTLKKQQKQLLDSQETFKTMIRDLSRAREKLGTANKSLKREKERAEEANIAKSEFLANMSHELRTPLNAIIGFSQMIMQNTFGPVGNSHYQEYIGDIYNSGRHLLTLINEILDMSKIEAGRFTIEYAKFDFVPVLEEALRAVSVQKEEKKISLETEIETPLWVEADNRALRQICLNLLSNAVKFTPENGTIRVRAKAIRGRLIVTIADSGIGIPKAALAKLGRPFEQVENQFTKAHEGSGLGLAISRSLTELHNGRLRIFSRENAGTIVSFSLPLRGPKKG